MDHAVYVTCCAAAKDPASGDLPASHRYRSARIDAVAALATRRGVDFRILSGRYGLLAPEATIPHYDHLLTPDAVAGHAGRVAEQLAALAPTLVVFFTRAAATDPDAEPYRTCCTAACALVGLVCEVVEVPDGFLTAEILERIHD